MSIAAHEQRTPLSSESCFTIGSLKESDNPIRRLCSREESCEQHLVEDMLHRRSRTTSSLIVSEHLIEVQKAFYERLTAHIEPLTSHKKPLRHAVDRYC